jgi:predicted RNA methylase
MATVAEHYRTHLAPVYAWMAGGVDAAVARGESEIAAILPGLSAGSSAVDLGAGFGMHTIPLGRRGCAVLAVDSCPGFIRADRAGTRRHDPGRRGQDMI